MSIIQGQGVAGHAGGGAGRSSFNPFSDGFTRQLKREFEWVGAEGERLLDAFLVPPMQVVAAALNFVTLLVTNRHIFDLPLHSVRDFKDARALVAELGSPAGKKKGARAASAEEYPEEAA
jgi:hypothetical protein